MNLSSISVRRTIKLGAKNLLLHKARSILTMLGIIFGVCSVVAMLAIGEGASYEAQEAIRRQGSTNIILSSVKPPQDEQASGKGNSYSLTYGLTYLDAWRIFQSVPDVSSVTPLREIRSDALFGREKEQVKVIGTLPRYFTIRQRIVRQGRLLSQTDEDHARNICVVTENLARRLFGYKDPLNQTVRVGQFYYSVIGVVESTLAEPDQKEGQQSRWDLVMFIPLATARARFGETISKRSSGESSRETIQLHQIIVHCEETEHVESAALGIQRIMEHFHKKKDYQIEVPLRLLRQAEETKRIFTIVLGSIAAISLLVGGIGIMNIMLATVTERTREIGVRRALGARKADIVVQFLVETIVLSVGGGIIGVGLGWLIPTFVQWRWDIMTIVTWWSLIVAFGVSALVGVVFGLYPAKRAADLDPIEALRHE